MWGCLGDLVLKPELHWHATHPCPAADLIRVHSWFKNTASIRSLSCLSWTNSTHHQPPAFHPYY